MAVDGTVQLNAVVERGRNTVLIVRTRFILRVENEQADAGRDS